MLTKPTRENSRYGASAPTTFPVVLSTSLTVSDGCVAQRLSAETKAVYPYFVQTAVRPKLERAYTLVPAKKERAGSAFMFFRGAEACDSTIRFVRLARSWRGAWVSATTRRR